MTAVISQLSRPAYRSLPVPAGGIPAAKIISSQTMATYLAAVDVIAAAQQQAQEIRDQAEKILAAAHEQANEILHEAQLAAVVEIEERVVAERAALHKAMQLQLQQQLSQAMQWMVEVAAIEKTIVQRLEGKIRAYLLPSVEALLGEELRAQALLKQIGQCLPDLIGKGSVTLQINPQMQVAVSQQLAHEPRICIVPNLELEASQAILDNGLLQIKIDFDQYFEQFRTLLRHSSASSNVFTEGNISSMQIAAEPLNEAPL